MERLYFSLHFSMTNSRALTDRLSRPRSSGCGPATNWRPGTQIPCAREIHFLPPSSRMYMFSSSFSYRRTMAMILSWTILAQKGWGKFQPTNAPTAIQNSVSSMIRLLCCFYMPPWARYHDSANIWNEGCSRVRSFARAACSAMSRRLSLAAPLAPGTQLGTSRPPFRLVPTM